MPYKDLREWIARLDREGELVTVKEPVSPYLEMAEIADRAAKLTTAKYGAGGPALLFTNITGYPGAQTLMNQFGSERRMKLALEVVSLDGIAERIRTLLHPPTPVSFLDKLKLLPTLAEVGSFFPKIIDRAQAACKEVILKGDQVDLTRLPVLTTWPQDGGPFITLPCVITQDAKSKKRNVGMYRMQVYDRNSTGMHWQRQKNAAEQLRDRARSATSSLAEQVELMAVTAGASTGTNAPLNRQTIAKIQGAIAWKWRLPSGTDPATTFSAIVPAPPENRGSTSSPASCARSQSSWYVARRSHSTCPRMPNTSLRAT